MDEIVDINTLFGPLPAASSDLNVDALLTLMQKHKVGTACTLSTLGRLLDPNLGNAATRAACAEHSELLPVATLNPTMYFGDYEALLKLREKGFRMLRFFPAAQGWPVDFAPFRAILKRVDELHLPVMVDIEKAGEITALMSVMEHYPAPVVLTGVDVSRLAEAVAALRLHPNWHLETSGLLAMGAIRAVTEAVGATRLLFGTSAPSHPIASALYTVGQASLSVEDRRLVMAGNARRILH